MTATQLRDFLKALEARIAPHQNGHHAITFAQYGSDDAGWDDRLALHVRVSDHENMTLFLDDADFLKPMETLLDDVVAAVGVHQ